MIAMQTRHNQSVRPRKHTCVFGPVLCHVLLLLLACLLCGVARAGPENAQPEGSLQNSAEQGALHSLFGATARKMAPNDMNRAVEWRTWQQIINNGDNSRSIEELFAKMPSAYLSQWKAVCAQYEKSPPIEQLRLVSGFFNNWPSRSDLSTYGQEEYWATAEEFLQNTGGDCEDFAIVKYEALRLLGWNLNDLWIVLVHDNTRNTNHAVLAARAGNSTYVLDNLSAPRNLILLESKYNALYTPIAAMSLDGMWLFEKAGKATTTLETVL